MTHLVNILSAGETTLDLVSALLLYQSRDGHVYATTHPINLDADQPHRKIIGAGVPLTKTGLAAFAQAVSTATAFSGFLPANLLYTSPNLIAWWTPAAIRTTWFKSNDPALLTGHGAAAHPPLVFVAVPDDWYVFALRKDERPAPGTRLCHSPHFNVWDGGRICTGNVDLPAAVDAAAITRYEEAFFRSHFTHPNRKKAVKYKGGMKQLWRDQLAHPNPEATRRALVTSDETLQAAIARIAAASQKQR
jgi:PRTRC genetic system protein B